MPIFSTEPPRDPRGHGLPLTRTPPNGKLVVAITSNQMLGCPTHWYGGRTVPCEGENCKPCLEGFPWRWHGYLAGLTAGTRQHVLCEFTAQAAETINNYAKEHHGLRGVILTSHRHKNRHNGRVLVSLKLGDIATLNLPNEPDVPNALAILWNLPVEKGAATDTLKKVTRIVPKPKGTKAASSRKPKSKKTV